MSVTDRTAAVARRMADRLAPGEHVLVAVSMDLEGTATAALSGGATAGLGVAVGFYVPDLKDVPELKASRTAADQAGWSGGLGSRLVLALTTDRLLLLKRRLFGAIGDVALDVPLGDVTALTMSRRSEKVTVQTVRGAIPLELPKAWKFLPPVYGTVPEVFRRLKGT